MEEITKFIYECKALRLGKVTGIRKSLAYR